jgi:signal transduction histidine kinase
MAVELMVDRVREMALDLYPPQLEDFGLCAALRSYCTQQGDKESWIMHLDLAEVSERPSREVELACFHVAQEALANVAMHARATNIWVSLHQSADELRLILRDNGVGFDTNGIREDAGMKKLGLIGLEERVRQVGGRIKISSVSGSGTEVEARFVTQFHQIQTSAVATDSVQAAERLGLVDVH